MPGIPHTLNEAARFQEFIAEAVSFKLSFDRCTLSPLHFSP
jgi:hypothetical protein